VRARGARSARAPLPARAAAASIGTAVTKRMRAAAPVHARHVCSGAPRFFMHFQRFDASIYFLFFFISSFHHFTHVLSFIFICESFY
jgi:hypothetical protein